MPPARSPAAIPLEGYVYGANHNLRLIEYLVLVGTATGTKPAGLQEYATKLGINLIHALKPNRWQVPDEADYPGDNTGLLTVDLPVLLADVLAGTPLGAHLDYLVANVGAPPGELSLPRSGAHVLLYGDAKRPRADYRATEPLTYHSAGDEHLFMRSSWADDAVWASVCGGLTQLSGHQARVAGHFAVQRGNDYLLVYAGQLKGKTGLTGRPEQFQTTSAFANTLFIDDGGDYLYPDEQVRRRPRPVRRDQAVSLRAAPRLHLGQARPRARSTTGRWTSRSLPTDRSGRSCATSSTWRPEPSWCSTACG